MSARYEPPADVYPDWVLVLLYRAYSDQEYGAGWYSQGYRSPDFVRWLRAQRETPPMDYEREGLPAIREAVRQAQAQEQGG